MKLPLLRTQSGSRVFQRLMRLAACTAVLASGALTPCALLRAQGTGQNIIRGKVSGPDGRPVEVQVNLREVTRNVVNSTLSNSNGDFTFEMVGDGRYYVTVDSDLYQHSEVATRVAWSINPYAVVLVSLAPLPGTSKKPEGEIQKGSPSITVQELKAKFSKKAVKEYEKGNTQMGRGEVEAAIESYQRAVALAPEMYPALNNLGNAYLGLKRLPEAEAAFRKALAANPGGAEPCINLGHLFYERKQYDQAEKFLRRGLERYPHSALAYLLLGFTYARTGNLQAAETNFLNSLAQNDASVVGAHLELANLYLRTNRRHKAREQLEAYLQAQPNDPQADRIRQTIARLKNPAEQTP